MLMSHMPSSSVTRLAWRMRCSNSWPVICALANSTDLAPEHEWLAMTDEPSSTSAEDRLIARYFRPLAKHPGALALIDDVALLTPPAGHDIVLTTDAIVGGVHFFPDDPPDMVAKKALRVNLSDLAAKGATPTGFLLTLALPTTVANDWIESFAHGLGADAD